MLNGYTSLTEGSVESLLKTTSSSSKLMLFFFSHPMFCSALHARENTISYNYMLPSTSSKGFLKSGFLCLAVKFLFPPPETFFRLPSSSSFENPSSFTSIRLSLFFFFLFRVAHSFHAHSLTYCTQTALLE